MKILVRLPNWLGDMVMSVALLEQLSLWYPNASISVVVKQGLEDLLDFFPVNGHRFVFSKQTYHGIRGAWTFGREIRQKDSFDLFICLPDSLSSAVMSMASGASERIGYKKEGRGALLTQSFEKPIGLHRVEEYLRLMELATGLQAGKPRVRMQHHFLKKNHVIININSEASSRRLTLSKAASLIATVRSATGRPLVLIGSPKEEEFVSSVLEQLPEKEDILNLAGKTTLHSLCKWLAGAHAMLTTDSGPGHLANAFGTPTVSLFGAGNESNTAPYNADWRTIIRLGQLPCEPCEKNKCKLFPTPQCLERLNNTRIAQELQLFLSNDERTFS